MKVVMIEMLQEANVSVLTHVWISDPIMEKNVVKGVFIETKIGRKAILAKVVVDCTGEADVLEKTGCPMRIMQGTCSLAFKMSNVDEQAFYEYFKQRREFPKTMTECAGLATLRIIGCKRDISIFLIGEEGSWRSCRRTSQRETTGKPMANSLDWT